MCRDNHPEVLEEPDSITVRLRSDSCQVRSVSVPAVIDIGRASEIVGIEILNLFSYVGQSALNLFAESLSGGGETISYSYDADSDAFYLRLRKVDAPRQRAVRGLLALDIEDRVVEIRANWELP